MKKLMKLSVIALVACAVIYSCKKKDDPAPVAATTAGTTTTGTTTTGTTTTGTTTSGTTSGTTTSTTPTKTSMLVNKKWGMSAFTVSPGVVIGDPSLGLTVTDLFDATIKAVYPCITDDTLSFSSTSNAVINGLFTSMANAKCGTEKDGNGTWTANTDFTQITIVDNANSQTIFFKVLELTDKKMKVETVRKNPLDATDTKDYTATITFNSK